MLHWPDSMETFLKEDRILFSNDGFGQHIATSNILMPFHMPLLRFFKVLDEQGIEPLQIAPSHGIIWKQDLTKILAAYRAWANGEVKEKVLVIYDTMWGSTEIMANEIAEAVRAARPPD